MHQQTPPPETSPVLYDRAEVAARLSMSLRMVDGLIARKAIPIVKIGRAVRITPQALASFIEANTVR